MIVYVFRITYNLSVIPYRMNHNYHTQIDGKRGDPHEIDVDLKLSLNRDNEEVELSDVHISSENQPGAEEKNIVEVKNLPSKHEPVVKNENFKTPPNNKRLPSGNYPEGSQREAVQPSAVIHREAQRYPEPVSRHNLVPAKPVPVQRKIDFHQIKPISGNFIVQYFIIPVILFVIFISLIGPWTSKNFHKFFPDIQTARGYLSRGFYFIIIYIVIQIIIGLISNSHNKN